MPPLDPSQQATQEERRAARLVLSPLASELARFAEAQPPPVHTASALQAGAALAVAAVLGVLFDSEGLVTWAQRLEVSRAQTALLSVLEPLHHSLAARGFAAPRRALASTHDSLARALGAEEDPLLAEGWVAPPEAEPAPSPLAMLTPSSLPPPPLDATGVELAAPALPGDGVLLLGDSMMAGSLGGVLRRTLKADPTLRVAHAWQLSTGLSRPEVYDWMKVLPALLRREQPRFVVVSFGTNDATNIRLGDEPIDFGDPSWRDAYAARVDAMMRVLSASGARVLWLGLPPMRDRHLGRRTRYLNGIFAQCARRVPRVEYLQLDMLVSTPQLQYATFLPGPDGRLVRYRLDDGVHFAPAGARAISRWIVDWIRERRRFSRD